MKLYVDSKLLESVTNDNRFAKEEVVLNWPSLLTYLKGDQLFDALPLFDQSHEIFTLIKDLLCNPNADRNLFIELYDLLFADCLTQIKNLQEVKILFFLERIDLTKVPPQFEKSLKEWNHQVRTEPKKLLHEMTLYLAWDRMCVRVAQVFEWTSPAIKSLQGFGIFQDCLIESFVHITKQGETRPSFFRLAEALYAYYMRQENLQNYNDSEWEILSKGVQGLKSRDQLGSIDYIDEVVEKDEAKSELVTCVTNSSLTEAIASRTLADFFMDQLNTRVSDWPYKLSPAKVFALTDGDFIEILLD